MCWLKLLQPATGALAGQRATATALTPSGIESCRQDACRPCIAGSVGTGSTHLAAVEKIVQDRGHLGGAVQKHEALADVYPVWLLCRSA